MSQLPVELAWRLAERAEEHRWLVTGLWADPGSTVGRPAATVMSLRALTASASMICCS